MVKACEFFSEPPNSFSPIPKGETPHVPHGEESMVWQWWKVWQMDLDVEAWICFLGARRGQEMLIWVSSQNGRQLHAKETNPDFSFQSTGHSWLGRLWASQIKNEKVQYEHIQFWFPKNPNKMRWYRCVGYCWIMLDRKLAWRPEPRNYLAF